MAHDLRRLLDPKSVAVVGASAAPLKPGGRVIRYLNDHGFSGEIYPINPGRDEINGHRCYPSLTAIGRPVDTVIVAVAATEVPAVIGEAVTIGAGGAIVFSGGFSEVGSPEGRELQRQLVELIDGTEFALIGPNSAGVVNVGARATLSMGINFFNQPLMRFGGIGLITQGSGGGLNSLVLEVGLGCTYWLNVGNAAGVQVAECIQYLASDPETKVIATYMEGITDPGALLEAGREARLNGKPVIALRSGRTAAGARATASHTGSLAVPDRIAQAFLHKCGIVSVDSQWDLVGAAQVLRDGRVSTGSRLLVVSNSGSMGAMTADAAELRGLEVVALSESAVGELRTMLPSFVGVGNPVDVTTPPLLEGKSILQQAVDVVSASQPVDNVIVALMLAHGFPLDVLCPQVANLFRTTDKMMAVVVNGTVAPEAVQLLQAEGVPVFRDIPAAVRALVTARQSAMVMPSTEVFRDISGSNYAPGGPARTLNEAESVALAARYDVPFARSVVATTAANAADAAVELGFPVAVKVLSADVPHKSDTGGVRLNLTSTAEVLTAAESVLAAVGSALPEARVDGLLVQEMCSPGIEVLVGAVRDPVFGPTITFGLGGVAVELFQDVALAVSPLSRNEARALIARTQSSRLLMGFRGKPPADIEALTDLILNVDRLMQGEHQVRALDLNPVLVYPEGQGLRVVDALVVVDSDEGREEP